MDSLPLELRDSFDAISLILVFVFVLFDIRYPQITRVLQKDIPPKERKIDRENLRKGLRECLLRNDLPLVAINGILLYLFLPLLIQVLQSSKFALWGFDFSRTAFVVVFGLILFFFAWSAYLGYLIVRVMRKIR